MKRLRPTRLEDALEFRAEYKALPFAGGTDLMVRHRGYTGTLPKIQSPVLFLDALDELKTLEIEKQNRAADRRGGQHGGTAGFSRNP